MAPAAGEYLDFSTKSPASASPCWATPTKTAVDALYPWSLALGDQFVSSNCLRSAVAISATSTKIAKLHGCVGARGHTAARDRRFPRIAAHRRIRTALRVVSADSCRPSGS